MAHHLIQGRAVEMPVRVREAAACFATYLVRADAARAVIAYSGLDVSELLPGRAVCTLFFVRYADSDLGSYGEFGVSFMVRPPGAERARGGGMLAGVSDVRRVGTGMFVHWLPVNQGFTMEAGRSIWGFPKELADIELRMGSPYKRCVLRKDGRLVLDLLLRPGVPVPAAGAVSPFDAYTNLDGVTRRTPWSISPRGVRARPGGALIRLGNHPIAKELSELGLPKHALLTTTVARLSMTIGDATEE
ncbi:acetoacetate decarboxylase family protein [Spongiactinospora sp. TRM90649]|uniref:acetoacetate decarboxylase family protein n=1 Tax=Spongiactinospora sp. TRM90649 TaxID=3031114 RepID=UPI0023F8E1F7|nr:acetoacetate decarboxylase family protein [Spongiactinospora sp. TRM90649]MDF5751191.1 acetoacetate decarboxylase family protein [Spongiactinospora sp. TRM90649]